MGMRAFRLHRLVQRAPRLVLPPPRQMASPRRRSAIPPFVMPLRGVPHAQGTMSAAFCGVEVLARECRGGVTDKWNNMMGACSAGCVSGIGKGPGVAMRPPPPRLPPSLAAARLCAQGLCLLLFCD